MTSEEEENAEKTKQVFDELCRNLNVDEVAASDAWDSYESINKNYTLEGNNLHWLACALYVACRRTIPTVSQGTVEGNYVSLTKILQYSHQSWIEFFKKMKKWEDMADLQPEFRERTSKLERNFTVSAVIYKKYEPIFRYIFRDPQEDQPRQQRGRKQRRQPCTSAELFEFCWVLFIFAKGNFPMISDDLVNSYHLLLCALDLVYGNVLLCSNRKELLNPSFNGLPEDFNSRDYRPPSTPPCVIGHLCSVYDGVVLDAKGIKEHYWKPYIKKIFDKKILKGREDSLVGFLDPGNFGESLKALSRAYEEYILSVGTLDERIFLAKDTEDGTPGKGLSSTSEKETTDNLQNKAFSVSTPLTGRHYIKESNLCATPITTAMYGVSRLHTMLAGVRCSPSEKLLQIFRSCSKDPSKSISNRLQEMYDVFCVHYIRPDTEYSSCCKDIATKYFRLAEVLYYKVLECALETEKKRLGDIDLTKILDLDVFHRSLIACCLEIVLFSYKPPGCFPWIIDVFELQPYNFYKVIEVTIRAEDNLFREVVKHLNSIEEKILESLAWKKSSPLWTGIRDADNKIPSCQDVMPPQYFENSTGNITLSSPVTPSRTNEVRVETGGLGPTASPSPATLHERYSSPTAGSARRRLFPENEPCSEPAGQARIPQPQVINTVPAQSIAPETVSVTPVPGQTLVTMATATVTANNGQTVTIPVHGIATENGGITFIPVQLSMTAQSQTVPPLTAQTLAGSLSTQQITGTSLQMAGPVTVQAVPPSPGQQQRQTLQGAVSRKQKKMGSLCLFIRKVFHLASVRLRDLSDKLEISDELRKIIWTCFEFSLIQFPDLMMDRHLDQLLMCAVYVMAKVTQRDKSFHDIMKCYRTQPQASSLVYRSVPLKERRKRRCSGSSDSSGRQGSPSEISRSRSSRDCSPLMRSDSTLPVPQPNSAPPTPTCLTGANSDAEEEERGDLIQFYNDIYTEHIEDFAKKYSPTRRNEAPPLSPYPCHRTSSPRRVQLSQHHSIYISPHENSEVPTPQGKMLYCFSSSPSKMLKDINNMIKSGETPTKKRGILLEDGSESPAKRICQENQSALMRRLQDVANDRGSH